MYFNKFLGENIMYNILAYCVDVIHIFVIIFLVGGIYMNDRKFPRLKIFHSIFCIIVFVSQLFFNMVCPLVIIASYLRKMANPDYKIVLDSFVLKILREQIGISLPSCVMIILSLLITIFALTNLIAIIKIKKHAN